MDFQLSSEQTMLRDGARRFVAQYLAFDAKSPADCWTLMAELGWLMLPVPEAYEGLGGGADDIGLVAEELGRGLAREPFIEAAMLPAQLLALAGTEAQRREMLPTLATGELRLAVALLEPRLGFGLTPSCTIATAQADGFSLSGAKIGVEGGARAGQLIVSAWHLGATALFLVPVDAAFVERTDYDSIDGRTLSDFRFNAVPLPSAARLTSDVDADAAIAQAVDGATVAACAEALGCIDRAIELTAEYLKIRQQFGQSLANFQALQHGMANLFIEANDARSIVYRAMSELSQAPAQRIRAVSSCKIKVMEAARSVTGTAVHFHGGIGVTTEYSIGHYLRRVLVLEQRFGNSAYHFERLMQVRD